MLGYPIIFLDVTAELVENLKHRIGCYQHVDNMS